MFKIKGLFHARPVSGTGPEVFLCSKSRACVTLVRLVGQGPRYFCVQNQGLVSRSSG